MALFEQPDGSAVYVPRVLLPKDWDPERPYYDQIVGEEDELDFAEAFAELADDVPEPAPERVHPDETHGDCS